MTAALDDEPSVKGWEKLVVTEGACPEVRRHIDALLDEHTDAHAFACSAYQMDIVE